MRREKAGFSYMLYSFFYVVYVLLIQIDSVISQHIDLIQRRTYEVTPGIIYRVVFCFLYIFLLLTMTHLSRGLQKRGVWFYLAGLTFQVLLTIWLVYHSGSLNMPALMLGAAVLYHLGDWIWRRNKNP